MISIYLFLSKLVEKFNIGTFEFSKTQVSFEFNLEEEIRKKGVDGVS